MLDSRSTRGTQTYRAPAVVQAIHLLEEFTIDAPEHSLSELSRALRVSKSTVHRLLVTLLDLGWLERDPATDRYRLGLKVFERGSVVIARMELRSVAEPVLERLMEATGETVHLSVRDGLEMMHIAKVESRHSIRMGSRIGKRTPLHCTGVGKVLLAGAPSEIVDALAERGLRRYTASTITDTSRLRRELEKIRADGYGLDREEIEDGLRCAAAPIRDVSGAVVAAVSAAGPAQRMTDARMPALIAEVKAAGADISHQLGHIQAHA